MKKFSCTKVVEKIKSALAVLSNTIYYDPLEDTQIKCDARRSGIGATLKQISKDGDLVPKPFASRFLNIENNSSNELELLAVVWVVDRIKDYVLGKED